MKPLLFLLPVLLAFVASCTHDEDLNVVDPLNVGQELFRSTVFVDVRDTDGNPLKGVSVKIGNFEKKTDHEGFVMLHDVYVGNTTYLVAEQEGYFHASRKFYPTPGRTNYIRLILLKDNGVAFFTASQGAYIAVSDDVSLDLPADGYTLENGDAYQGVVVVAAQAISSDDPDLSFKMPGDLVGLCISGETGSLASMGMVAVTLRTPEGELLNLKADSKARIKMKIGGQQLSKAPQTIPMWYFDEALGIWKEEGTATLEGSYYVAEVSHFSYWNYDTWFEVIKWGAFFTIGDTMPASQTLVCITIQNLNTKKCEYTNEDGMVCGLVAAGEILQIEVYDDCGEVFYSQMFGPYSDSVMISSIPMSEEFLQNRSTRIEGFAVDCENQPVTDLFAKIVVGEQAYFESVSSQDGSLSVMVMNCAQADLDVSLFSADGLAFNLAGSFPYAPVVNFDTLSVCNQLNEYVIMEYGLIPERIILIQPSYHDGEDGHCFGASDNDQNWFHICMDQIAAGDYVNDEWGNIILRPIDNVELGTHSLNITITYSGGKGDLLQGTFSGLLDSNHDLQYLIPVKGSFSVLRD